MSQKILFLSIFLFATRVFGGGGSGGTPPAIEVSENDMHMLQAGALNDDLIRVTELGRDSIYFKGNKTSIQSLRMSANALPTGEEFVFTAESPATRMQGKVSLSVARSIQAIIPGLLPVTSRNFLVEMKPKVEIVPK